MNTLKTESDLKKIHLQVAKTVLVFWLLGWFLKVHFFVSYLFVQVIHYPFVMDFFPPFLRSPLVLQFFYFLPVIALWAIFKPNLFYLTFSGVLMLISSAILLLHQDTHNDATFLTSFFVAAWFLWFVRQMPRLTWETLIHAKSLGLCIIAVIFWGGFIGKLTPEYWGGSVFTNIFLMQDYGWMVQLMHKFFSEEFIRWFFFWSSKMIIVGEGILTLAPILPFTFIFYLGIVLMVSISFVRTWMIFSVLFCLIGLLLGLKLIPTKRQPL